MKRILMICVALLGMVLTSCHQDEDDLFTTAAITLAAEQGTTVERARHGATHQPQHPTGDNYGRV